MNTSRSRVGGANATGSVRLIDESQQHMRTTMKNILLSAVAAGALAAGALAVTATANAAPIGPPSVDATVDQLAAQGFDVIVERIGTGPSGQCTLGAVRPGQRFSRTDSGGPGAGDDRVTTVISNTVYVDIVC